MNAIEETTFTITTVISIVVFISGFLGVYHISKGRINANSLRCKNIEKKHHEDMQVVEKTVEIIHNRITKTNEKIDEKTDELTTKIEKLAEKLHLGQLKELEYKNEILRAIASSK